MRTLLFLLFTLFIGVTIAKPLSLREAKPEKKVFVVSHRGDWQVAPENSLGALYAALRAGVDVVETDVRLTKDEQCVILHDRLLDRTTTGRGDVSTFTLEEVQTFRLRDALGTTTQEHVPSLCEFFTAAKGKVYLYLDKAGAENGRVIPFILALAREMEMLDQLIFVLNWRYEKARAVFGDDLERVLYCPVISDDIPDLEQYVEEWLRMSKPVAFQFRFHTLESKSYALLPRVLETGARAFVAATWPHHTANHDDRISLFETPDNGWGWLLDQGFTIIETNHPRAFIDYLSKRHAQDAHTCEQTNEQP